MSPVTHCCCLDAEHTHTRTHTHTQTHTHTHTDTHTDTHAHTHTHTHTHTHRLSDNLMLIKQQCVGRGPTGDLYMMMKDKCHQCNSVCVCVCVCVCVTVTLTAGVQRTAALSLR